MSMPSAPLYDGILKHNKKNRSSFHTPGHKNGRFLAPLDLYTTDLTELPDTDALYEAQGIIGEAEQLAARLFGTQATCFSSGGCTLCIQAMLRLMCPRGGKMLFGRTVHRSAVHAMALLGIEPVWVLPRDDAGEGLPGRVTCEDVKEIIAQHPDIVAVYLTTPDYYGCLTDLSDLCRFLDGKNIPLVLDCAHGSHLFFQEETAGYTSQAAMAACSAHKTLPVLTGGAFLHIYEERFVPGAKEAMALFGSTSPAYPVLASLDVGRAFLEQEGALLFEKLRKRVNRIKKMFTQKGFRQPLGLVDPVRLTFSAMDLGYTGEEVAEYLRTQGVEPEYADQLWVVLLPTIMNEERDFERLEKALLNLEPRAPLDVRVGRIALPAVAMTPRQALFSPREKVPVVQAVGRIAADVHCPCPPGVPVVMPGEIVDEQIKRILLKSGNCIINMVK